MTPKFEYKKRLTSWCLNIKANETKRNVSFDNFASNTPDRARREIGDQKNLGWLRKMSARMLLLNIFLTLLCSLIFYQQGINMIFLLVGFFIAIVFVTFTWKTQMQRYDSLIKQPFMQYSKKEKYLFLVFTLLLSLIYTFFDITGREYVLQAMFSFYAGFLAYLWLCYVQILYWEQMNHKTIYFDKNYGIWKNSYIIMENK